MEKLLELVTPGNIALLLVGLGYFWMALKWVSQRTETKKDDKIVEIVDHGLDWVFQIAPYIWHVVEAANKFSGIPSGMTKSAKFLSDLHDAYAAQKGKQLPKQAADLGTTIAEGLSAAEKLGKKISPDSK